jgi:hypothetical protein
MHLSIVNTMPLSIFTDQVQPLFLMDRCMKYKATVTIVVLVAVMGTTIQHRLCCSVNVMLEADLLRNSSWA